MVMEKVRTMYYQMAVALTAILGLVLTISANTNSCCLVYQPEAPESLKKFSKIK